MDHASIPLALTVMEDYAQPGDILSSLLIALSEDDNAGSPGRDPLRGQARCVRRPRGRPVLADRSRAQRLRPRPTSEPASRSVPGRRPAVCISDQPGHRSPDGSGLHTEQAELEIDARAAVAGQSRSDAADIILSSPQFDDVDPAPEAR